MYHENYFFSFHGICLSSNPLFSSIATLSLLTLIYFPHLFLRLSLSPLFISTVILLILIFKLGVHHQTRVQTPKPKPEPEPDSVPKTNCDPNPCRRKVLVDWDVGAPLEAIYEAYEGDEEGVEDRNDASKANSAIRIRRYPSLSRYYPDSGSDPCGSSSSWDGEWLGFHWDEEEEERDGLIEIDLHHDYDHDYDDHNKVKNNRVLELSQVDEEDNLIEIDISPNRND